MPLCKIFILFTAESLKLKAHGLREHFLNKLKLMTVDSQARSAGLSPTAQGLDLVFAIDYSESVGKSNFKKAVEFVRSLVEHFGLSSTEDGTHVAVVVFSSQARLIFNLKSQKVFDKNVALEELGKTLL